MEKRTCETCIHFCQHYRKAKTRYVKVHCGHCIYPRVKTRMPDTKACDKYREKAAEKK